MDKPSHLTFKLQTFDADEIDGILEASGNFRDLQPRHRNNLLAAMEDEHWEAGNGEVITFTEDGILINGQHRLSAAAAYQRAHRGEKVWFWSEEFPTHTFEGEE